MLGARALVVDDNVRLAGLLAGYLSEAGFCVTTTGSAQDFDQLACLGKFDLYIVDLGLPDGDGIDLVRSRRSARDSVPILIVTARVTVDDRVRALQVGADDCLVKPFHPDEFVARARAMLRRPQVLANTVITAGHVTIDGMTGEVTAHGTPVKMRRVEQRLLLMLARKLGGVVAKHVLESVLYDFGKEVSSNAIEQGISRLRGELKRADAGLSIRTVWGSGYVLEEIE